MRRILIVCVMFLAACAPRGELGFAQAPEPGRPIFVGTTRNFDPVTGDPTGTDRSPGLGLARYDVAVPPGHQPGQISYAKPNQPPDPARDFVVTGRARYPEAKAFRTDLAQEIARNGGEAVVFVHGYNTNFAEGLYRLAQLGADFDLPGVLVHYAWPSRAQVMGYPYDRDSALFARDGFQELLEELRRAGAQRILLVSHSMGGALTMETLRQMAISADSETLSRISGLILISPDLDVDVFRAQVARMPKLPEPFVIFTSQKDKALRLSGWISGEPARLGNLQDVSELADIRVTVIDTGAFSTREGHFNVGNSPALIAMLNRSGQVAAVLEGDRTGQPGLLPMAVLTVQNATQIVLKPVVNLGGG
ncbi:MAG: alpha/beta fold hydrolase [Sphingomonadales bacterium]|nr:alpha/beta fold hydrolase [Sphingomonadales bacterium]